MRTPFHRCIELDLKPERVGELQRAALERLLRENVGDPLFREERGSLVEILLVADLQSEPVAGGGRRLAQHQRVMLMLLAAAQVDRLVIAILDMQAHGVFIKLAAGIQIHDVKHGMAGSDDVEWRIEDVRWHRHVASLGLVIPECASWRRPESIIPIVVMIPGSPASLAPGMTAWNLHSQPLNLVRSPRKRDVLGFHVEVERIIAAVAAYS